MLKVGEHDEQVAFVQWFERRYPNVMIWATPNGGKRHVVTAVRMKKEGVKAGVPDLFIPEWRLFIEMKTRDSGVVSTAQKYMIDYLRVVGYTVEIAKGCDDAIQIVLNFKKK